MTAAIHAHNGIIDKFVDDGLMAFWTAPFSRGESHATDACFAALAQQRAIRELREHLSDVLGLRRDLPEFSVRMGLATGDLVVGTIGSTEARSFTVIGDTVNLASRLESANKAYETGILVDAASFQLAQNDVAGREIDFLAALGLGPSKRATNSLGGIILYGCEAAPQRAERLMANAWAFDLNVEAHEAIK